MGEDLLPETLHILDVRLLRLDEFGVHTLLVADLLQQTFLLQDIVLEYK